MPTIRTITIDELDGFGLDENNQLYWHGQKVKTRLELPSKIDVAAWLVTLAAAASAFVDVMGFFGFGAAR